jgi:excisionase family DNA binding protein
MSIERRFCTPKEISVLYSLHLQSVYSMIAAGIIPAVRLGRAIRCDLKALEAQLKAQAQGQAVSRGRR